jgi:hypothetical protein
LAKLEHLGLESGCESEEGASEARGPEGGEVEGLVQRGQSAAQECVKRGADSQPAGGGLEALLISGSTTAPTAVDVVPAAAGGARRDNCEQRPRPSPSYKKPSLIKFEGLAAIKRLICLCIKKEVFCVSSVKRARYLLRDEQA